MKLSLTGKSNNSVTFRIKTASPPQKIPFLYHQDELIELVAREVLQQRANGIVPISTVKMAESLYYSFHFFFSETNDKAITPKTLEEKINETIRDLKEKTE